MRLEIRPTAIAVMCLVVASGTLAACAGPSPTARATARSTAPTASGAPATPAPEPTSAIDAATFGRWRRAPVTPTATVSGAAQAACRAQDGVGKLPLRVLDARGEGLLTLVFADDTTALVCHAAVADDGTATADAGPVEGLADAPVPDTGQLGPHVVQLIDAASGPRQVIVGRVADVPTVEMSFDDATWARTSMAGGWYTAWWPQAALALTVASVDRRSVVIDSFPLP